MPESHRAPIREARRASPQHEVVTLIARCGDPDDISWIRSYVLEEGGGSVGTVCIYEASSPEAIREHASRADLPVDEIIAIADTVIVRPDPVAA